MQRGDIHLESLSALPIDLWNRKWFLLSAGDFLSGDYNCMTVSWGGLGTMWNKPFAMVVVRPDPLHAGVHGQVGGLHPLRVSRGASQEALLVREPLREGRQQGEGQPASRRLPHGP